MKIKIAIAYHKPAVILKGRNIFPLHVGKAISNVDLGIQGDNTGDNISEKNPLYCELTAIYWLWKNTTADFYGLMHYRRIFFFDKKYQRKKILLKAKIALRSLISVFRPLNSHGMRIESYAGTKDNYHKCAEEFDKNIEKILQSGINLIVPHPQQCLLPVSVTFSPESPIWAKQMVGEIANEKYPKFAEYYKNSFSKHHVYQRNMFIMDEATFNEYCTILFTILQTFEKRIISEGYIIDLNEKSMSRVMGYLSELITNAYIQYCIAKGLKIKKLPLMIFDNSSKYK